MAIKGSSLDILINNAGTNIRVNALQLMAVFLFMAFEIIVMM